VCPREENNSEYEKERECVREKKGALSGGTPVKTRGHHFRTVSKKKKKKKKHKRRGSLGAGAGTNNFFGMTWKPTIDNKQALSE